MVKVKHTVVGVLFLFSPQHKNNLPLTMNDKLLIRVLCRISYCLLST